MSRLKKYQALIQNLPLMEQAFTIKQDNLKWQEAEKELPFVKTYNGQNFRSGLLTLNREMLLNSPIDSEFILKVLYWGYPKGMRGDQNHLSVLKAAESISQELQHYRESQSHDTPSFTALLEKLLSKSGMGISTASKLLYFANIRVEGFSALILDERLIRCFKNKVFEDFASLTKVPYKMTAEYYLQYLRQLHQLAKELDTDPERIELFLFQFGNNLLETVEASR